MRCFLGFVTGQHGLKHSDSSVKQICVDLLSLIGQHFFLLAKSVGERQADAAAFDGSGRA